MKRTRPSTPEPSGAAEREPGFMEDLRSVLRPEKKWHYLFHAVVILVALSYWVVSLLELPDASWAEIIMYRPKGDNQVYPVIAALSRFNFGDPTDALHYGKGVAGFHAVILLPHALAVWIFGWPGYMLADAFFFLAYFVAVTMLLIRCDLGVLPSFIVGSTLATGALQSITNKASIALLKLVGIFDVSLSEWAFPNLVGLAIFETRIPRPLITEIFVVLILYFLIRAWRQCALLGTKPGLGLGVCMGLLAQGDPYSFSSLGLVLGALVIRNMARNRWQFPWRFVAALVASGLAVDSYFLFQLVSQHPDASVRFGMANYPRSQLFWLPGYGPLLRVGVVAIFSGIILIGTRKKRSKVPDADPLPASGHKPADLVPQGGASGNAADRLRSIAQICVLMTFAAWLAQPVQLFLLGKGAQIYHYLSFTLPTFYSYSMVLLVLQMVVNATVWFRGSANGKSPFWAKSTLLTCIFTGEILLGIEPALEAIKRPLTSRDEVTPFSRAGADYRTAFRALDKAFREEPELRDANTFATLSHEVNFLLAGFHNKRAFLPDNGFTTLSDRELEHRLFEVSKICQLHPHNQFPAFIQNHIVMNFWLGCAKYWFSTDHSYAPLSEYSDEQMKEFKKMGFEAPFSLALPPKEILRLIDDYTRVTFGNSDVSTYPDLLIVTLVLKEQKIAPHPSLYAEVYENDVFTVYRKTRTDGAYSAAPLPPP